MTTKETPKVAIVIVTWNKKDYVLNLLRSLREINYDNYDTIVVDNASSDGTADAIRAEFPAAELIVNAENLGGTGGFNTGMKYALKLEKYEYLWLLDNDVEVHKDALIELIKVLESDKSIGVAGSAMYNLSSREKLIEIGNFINLPRGRITGNKRLAQEEDIDRDFYIVESVSACSLCASTETIQNIGIWDESFFIYCDDVDWNIRFRKKGYKIAAVSKSKIWHQPWEFKAGFNTFYYANRNILYLINKHLTSTDKIFAVLYKELSIVWYSVLLLKSRQGFYSIIVLKSIIDFLDQKTGKFKEQDSLKELETIASKTPRKLWLSVFAQLIYRNIKTFLSVTKSVLTAGAIEAVRLIFKKLPQKQRIGIIKSINNFFLSK